MSSSHLSIKMLFLVQLVIGTMGNFSLLGQYWVLYISGCKSISMDLILRHLTVANTLVILSRGIPETMAALGLEDFLSDVGCKLVFYAHRVGRGVSMGSTCLLSVFQAITLSPKSSKWTQFNVKSKKHVSTAVVLCWPLHMLLNVTFPANVTAKWKNKNITNKIDFGYCSALDYDKVLKSVSVALFSISDVLCVGLMLCTSSSMVFLLYRHMQHVRHLHKTDVSRRSSPITRATHRTLVLVCMYVELYTVSCSIQACMAVFHNPSHLLLTSAALMNMSFPTVCPFLLMKWKHGTSKLICVNHRKNTVT